MFGSIRNTSAMLDLEDTVNALNTEISRYTRVGGLFYKVGALYETKLTEKMSLRLGVTGSLSQNIGATRTEYQISYITVNSTTIYDTASTTVGKKGEITLPMTISGGVQLIGRDKWRVGLDYNHTQWGQFRNFGNPDSLQASTYRISAGGEYTPNPQNVRKYWPRVSYRLGVSFGKDHIYLRNTDMSNYAITAGLSLPFRRSPDRIHTAFEFGSRGTMSNGLIKENFVKFTMGVSLNALADRWFVKRRLE
jgi:hypothetical protein